jgi:hypothetical protein
MKIGFTGTQRGMTKFQKETLREVLELQKCSEFCHGDCIGSDAQANQIALDMGIRIFTIFPPNETKKRAFCFNYNKLKRGTDYYEIDVNEFDIARVKWMPENTYLERNKYIVDSVEWMIATPKEHEHTLRSGTWATIRYAWKKKKGITIIPPVERPDNESDTKTD